MAIDLEYYLAQARRIAEHREEGAEEAIRKEFNKLRKSLNAYIAEVHEQYAKGDGTLSFADLQRAGYNARFLEEIEQRIAVATHRVAKQLHQLVEDTYELSYKSMIEGVEKAAKGADLGEVFADAEAITPEQISKSVQNPVMDVALEKNHRDIVYDIKQAVAVGLMNGDRYNTIAQKITVALDKENGPYKNAVRIARTEAHRVREMGNLDAALSVDKELQNGTTGLREVKVWKTMRDERVRPQRRRKGKKGWSTKMGSGPNHMKLEGQTVLVDEPFDLLDGYTAMSPGQSGIAGHDIHCRCYVSYKLMTDAEYYKATGMHFPGYKGKEEPEKAESASLSRAEMRQRIKDDRERIIRERASILAVDREIDKHYITEFDDLKGLKKSDISGRIKAIEDREQEIKPILHRLRNRPERGTPEYDEWREWRRNLTGRETLVEEEIKLAMDKAALQSKLRKFDRYDEWTKWKKDNPLDKLKSRRESIVGEIKRLEQEIKAFEAQLAANPVLEIVDRLKEKGVAYKAVAKHARKLRDSEIIEALAGGDMTQGSCASVGIAYIGQKRGLNVLDFRDGASRDYFSGKAEKLQMFKALGATPIEESSAKSNLTNGKRILSQMEKGKEYYLSVGRHAAIVRLSDEGVPQYLELQSSTRNGWHDFNKDVRETLKWRFGCSSSSNYWNAAYLTDIDQLPDSDDFSTLLGYINTKESEQRKGRHGTIK